MSDDHEFKLPGRAEQPPKGPRLDDRPAPEGTVWLNDWKGRRHKTKKAVLAAACQECRTEYQLTRAVANELASRASKWAAAGLVLDTAWQVMNVGGSTSDKAGKQLQYSRAEQDAKESGDRIWNAYLAAYCPNCQSDLVLIEAPRD